MDREAKKRKQIEEEVKIFVALTMAIYKFQNLNVEFPSNDSFKTRRTCCRKHINLTIISSKVSEHVMNKIKL